MDWFFLLLCIAMIPFFMQGLFFLVFLSLSLLAMVIAVLGTIYDKIGKFFNGKK